VQDLMELTKENLLKLGIMNIVAYSRKSRQDKNPEETMIKHKQDLMDFLNPLGIKYKIKEEIGSSEDISSRIVLSEILEKSEEEKIDAICYVNQSRLSRSVGDINRLFKFFKANNVVCLDLDKRIIRTFSGQAVDDDAFMQSVLDEAYIRQAKKVLNQGRRRSAQNGNSLIARMYGYERNSETKKLHIVEDEAEVVRKMYQMCLEGVGTKKIANYINSKGYRSINGNEFTYKQVWSVLINEKYKGWNIWNKESWTKVDGKWTVKKNDVSKWIIVKDSHEAIIDSNTWDKVAEVLREKGKLSPKQRNNLTWASGLFTCAKCDRTLTIFKRKDSLYLRACQKQDLSTGQRVCNVSGGVITDFEVKLINDLKKYKVEIKNELKNMKPPKSRDFKTEIKKMQKDIESIESQMDTLMDLLEKGIYTPKMFSSRYKKHEESIKQLEEQLEKIKEEEIKQISPVGQMKNTIDQIDNVLDNIRNDDESKRNLLWKSIIDTIVWDKEGRNGEVNIEVIFK
jgi:DNA invertase Pin-like site-specific DNA recombinase